MEVQASELCIVACVRINNYSTIIWTPFTIVFVRNYAYDCKVSSFITVRETDLVIRNTVILLYQIVSQPWPTWSWSAAHAVFVFHLHFQTQNAAPLINPKSQISPIIPNQSHRLCRWDRESSPHWTFNYAVPGSHYYDMHINNYE